MKQSIKWSYRRAKSRVEDLREEMSNYPGPALGDAGISFNWLEKVVVNKKTMEGVVSGEISARALVDCILRVHLNGFKEGLKSSKNKYQSRVYSVMVDITSDYIDALATNYD